MCLASDFVDFSGYRFSVCDLLIMLLCCMKLFWFLLFIPTETAVCSDYCGHSPMAGGLRCAGAPHWRTEVALNKQRSHKKVTRALNLSFTSSDEEETDCSFPVTTASSLQSGNPGESRPSKLPPKAAGEPF